MSSEELSLNYSVSAPVAIIIFRRPELTKRVLEKISQVRPKKLYIIADGPNPGDELEREKTAQTRELFGNLSWECEVVKIFADSNLGLKRRVVTGLDEVFKYEDSAIILEDDCLPEKDFFRFCDELLKRYESTKQVGLISGNFFGKPSEANPSYFFGSHPYIWGWATWSRTWHDFRRYMADTNFPYEVTLRKNLVANGQMPRRFKRLVGKMHHLDSWAIPFSIFCYVKEVLTVMPPVNLVTNIGFGADSTHTKFESIADSVSIGSIQWPVSHPDSVAIDKKRERKQQVNRTKRWLGFFLQHPLETFARLFRYMKLRIFELRRNQ